MARIKAKKDQRVRRHRRIRSRIFGNAERPRLSVFRSNKHIWAQLIDDLSRKTVCASSDRDVKQKAKLTTAAEKVGLMLAEKAKDKKIYSAVFDRGGYRYHGIVRAVAEGARKGGLKL